MARVNNSEITQALRKAAGIQPGAEPLPNFLSSGIVPTIELNPQLVKGCMMSRKKLTNALNAAFFTTPTNQDIYLLGVMASEWKDASATQQELYLTWIQNGGTQYLSLFESATTTACNNMNMTFMFPRPIKVDRGTIINLASDTNVANFVAYGQIFYFIDESSNG